MATLTHIGGSKNVWLIPYTYILLVDQQIILKQIEQWNRWMIIFYIERHHFEFSTVLYTIIEKYRLTVTVYYVSIFCATFTHSWPIFFASYTSSILARRSWRKKYSCESQLAMQIFQMYLPNWLHSIQKFIRFLCIDSLLYHDMQTSFI